MSPALFTRGGTAYVGQVERDEKGRPFYRRQEKCGRCGGAGGSDKWRLTGWTCFDCQGSGQGPIRSHPLYTAERLAKLDAAQAKRQAARQAAQEAAQAARKAEADARRDAFLAQHGAILEAAKATGDAFAAEVVATCLRDCKLSERQAELLQRAIAKAAERAASVHVGAIGERIELTLRTERLVDITPGGGYPRFGRRFLFLCRDEHGNRIVYKGWSAVMPGEQDEPVHIRAKVAEHSDYNGEKQTRIERPTLAPLPKAQAGA